MGSLLLQEKKSPMRYLAARRTLIWDGEVRLKPKSVAATYNPKIYASDNFI